MTLRLTLGLCLLAVALPGLADEDETTSFDIQIVALDGDDTIDLAFSSDTTDFDFMNMQVGENHSFTDDKGRNILVTREDDGFRLDIDGKTVELPDFGGLHGSGEIDIDVDVDERIHVERFGPSGITIMSDKTIDDTTRQSIESVLRSAGYDDAVNFVDESSVKKIHKVIRMKETL